MSLLRVLAFSSSRAGGGTYLQSAVPVIGQFLGAKPLQIVFIPFAAVDDYAGYGRKVAEALVGFPYHLQVAYPHNAAAVIKPCNAIIIGGGNTFKLLHDLYALNLVELIKTKVQSGTPYIGWSAGSNLTGLSIRTTNDMPVVQPLSFTAFGFFPFQINPHYFNEVKENFHGETRDQRLEEFVKLNPATPVVCLPEGTWLRLENHQTFFEGMQTGVIMHHEKGSVVKQSLAQGKFSV